MQTTIKQAINEIWVSVLKNNIMFQREIIITWYIRSNYNSLLIYIDTDVRLTNLIYNWDG